MHTLLKGFPELVRTELAMLLRFFNLVVLSNFRFGVFLVRRDID